MGFFGELTSIAHSIFQCPRNDRVPVIKSMKSAFPQHLDDTSEYRPMVRWFSPSVLLQTAKKVVPSTLFGQYSDRRLIHAALDSPIKRWALLKECFGGKKGICRKRKKPEIWVDYVADLGDGFNSTYATAYLIGQKQIKVGGISLPRADCLIMGGDQVYPYASRDDYTKRMQRAYKAAFPTTDEKQAEHPPVYLIPGNHDWYDGLTLFLARFCRGRATPLGSWNASQRRSYFAIHLGDNWWIWAFDSQLGEDVDKPQSDYFVTVARAMQPNAKVIICASVPTWLRASITARNKEEAARFYRGLDYIATIARDECPNSKVPLVLAGDLHHYSRYVDKESLTNFINAGGGGAFLHPTHLTIEDSIPIKWVGVEQTLEIGKDSADDSKKAIYPSQEISRGLSFGNIWFFSKNFDFSLLLGSLYWICALLMLTWKGYEESATGVGWTNQLIDRLMILWPTPVFLFVVIALYAILIGLSDIKTPDSIWLEKLRKWWASEELKPGKAWLARVAPALLSYKVRVVRRWLSDAAVFLTSRRFLVVTLHWAAQWTILLFGTALVSILIAEFRPALWGDLEYFVLLTMGMVILGFLGGFVWGIYLLVVSWGWGDEANNAFSAMRIAKYKNFLRIKIDGDQLTIYPVAIDDPPKDWTMNPGCEDGNQNTPVIIPANNPNDIGQRFIEKPIVIDMKDVLPLKAVART